MCSNFRMTVSYLYAAVFGSLCGWTDRSAGFYSHKSCAFAHMCKARSEYQVSEASFYLKYNVVGSEFEQYNSAAGCPNSSRSGVPQRPAMQPPQYCTRSTPQTLPLCPSLPHSSSHPRNTLLRHLRIHLLEPLAQPLGALKRLVDAAHHAALFLAQQRFGGEIVDAVGEASLHEIAVHLRGWIWVRSSSSGPASSLAVIEGAGDLFSSVRS